MKIPGAENAVVDAAKVRDYLLSPEQKYVVADTIQGPSGRSAQIVVVWIVLEGEEFPRFVTAFPGAKL